jgi:hypothetical protein
MVETKGGRRAVKYGGTILLTILKYIKSLWRSLLFFRLQKPDSEYSTA